MDVIELITTSKSPESIFEQSTTAVSKADSTTLDVTTGVIDFSAGA